MLRFVDVRNDESDLILIKEKFSQGSALMPVNDIKAEKFSLIKKSESTVNIEE